jgi:hypothetical protein
MSPTSSPTPYAATRAAAVRGTQPGSRAAGRRLDATIILIHLGTAGRGILWEPLAASGPEELLVDAPLPRRIRPY